MPRPKSNIPNQIVCIKQTITRLNDLKRYAENPSPENKAKVKAFFNGTNPNYGSLRKTVAACYNRLDIAEIQSIIDDYTAKRQSLTGEYAHDEVRQANAARVERENKLRELAVALSIADKIIYTDNEDKIEFFFREKFDLLFDDEPEWHCNPICEAGGIAIKI
jgi:hypothetical protein